jgi:GntR family transcriptional regulator
MLSRDGNRTAHSDYGWLAALLDRGSPVPLYYQLAQQLEAAIDNGRLAQGDLLGNEIELGDQLGISRPTVRRGIAMLADKGLLIRRRGVGTVIAPTSVKRPVALTSLYEDLAETGSSPRTKVLRMETVGASGTVADALRLADGDAVLMVERLRYANDEAVALMLNHLPEHILRDQQERLNDMGLYQLLRQGGVELRIASQRITAKCATAREARLLDIPKGAAMLAMTRTAYDQSGTPVEHGTHVYPASRYAFEMNLVSR